LLYSIIPHFDGVRKDSALKLKNFKQQKALNGEKGGK